MKNDKLKKNSFWILCGLVPLLVLIAVVLISSSVGGAIETRVAAIAKDKKELDGKNPKPTVLVARLEKLDEEVKKTKTTLWKENWERQQTLFTWPNSPQLKAVERAELKFGDKIPGTDDFTYDEFRKKEVYRAEFSTAGLVGVAPGAVGMADAIAPTQFNGGWEKVLRHVTDWGSARLTSDQLWLAMEDIWVQRSLLSAVRSVNTQMGEFRRVKYMVGDKVIDDPDPKSSVKDPLRRRFESRTWAVELEVIEKDNKKVLTGRLINLTDRLQLMGMGNTMVLKVWLSEGKDVRPFEFKIGGEFLPGVGSIRTVKVKDKDGKETGAEQSVPANVMEIIPTDDPTIRETTLVKEIVRVEQAFDARTVPIRRIEAMALGFRDSRHAGSELQLPTFIKPDEAPADGNAGGGTTPPGGTGLGSSAGPPPTLGSSGIGGGTGTPGAAASSAVLRGGGSLENVINLNKKRYIALTPDVRRLPVGVVVIVDQEYLQDVLLAFANSPLRFQITQVNWSRFRGTLGGLGTGGGSAGGTGDDIGFSGSGTTGGGDFGGPSLGLPGGMGGSSLGPPAGGTGTPPGGTGIPMGGSSLGPPAGGMGSPPGGTGLPGGTGFPGGGFGAAGRGTATIVSESQLTAGLIELQVYGIVSLYEKYAPEAPPEGTPKEGTPKDPTGKEPNPKDPVGKDPLGKDPAGKVPTGKEPTGKEPTGKEPTGKDSKEPDPKDKTPTKEPMGTDPKTSKMRRRIR